MQCEGACTAHWSLILPDSGTPEGAVVQELPGGLPWNTLGLWTSGLIAGGFLCSSLCTSRILSERVRFLLALLSPSGDAHVCSFSATQVGGLCARRE